MEAEHWLELASLALGLLAVMLAVSYALDKAKQRLRRRATLAGDLIDGGTPPAPLGVFPAALSEEEEDEEPTGAEEILSASPGPVVDWVLGAGQRLVVRTRRATDGHALPQNLATAGVLLLLLPVAAILLFPLLLVAVIGYLIDSGHDLRLRTIVGLFAADLVLQVFANL